MLKLTAETEFAAIFVPSCASAKPVEMKNTPARFLDPPSCRKEVSSSNGFQMAWPNIIVDDDETIIPIKDVRAKQMGMANN
jgi:hypothetical protein